MPKLKSSVIKTLPKDANLIKMSKNDQNSVDQFRILDLISTIPEPAPSMTIHVIKSNYLHFDYPQLIENSEKI